MQLLFLDRAALQSNQVCNQPTFFKLKVAIVVSYYMKWRYYIFHLTNEENEHEGNELALDK